MRRQYLGDKKDVFKWDYLNFLIGKLGFSALRILLMLTEDEHKKHVASKPREFLGACEKIYALCEKLAEAKTDTWRFLELIKNLPGESGGYVVDFCGREKQYFSCSERGRYFRGLKVGEKELVFVDPNTGFKPMSGGSCNHVYYEDVDKLLDLIPQSSLICVFQDAKQGQRTGEFPSRFCDINAKLKKRVPDVFAAAVCWDVKTMLIVLGKCQSTIACVRSINRAYCDMRRDVEPIPKE